MNILESAEKGTYWKSIIYGIITTEEFDPWDINVGHLADSYLKKVREIKMVDFEVPGTVVLVGAVLLKLKSDVVSGQTFVFEENLTMEEGEEEAEEPVADFDETGEENLPPSSLDEPELYVRRIPKRKVTLPELMVFLKRIIGQAEKKEKRKKESEGRQVEVQISKKNMERIMREVYRDIKKLAGGEKTTFRSLVEEWRKENVVAHLIPVLHLAQRNKIGMEQEKLFGDIFITPK